MFGAWGLESTCTCGQAKFLPFLDIHSTNMDTVPPTYCAQGYVTDALTVTSATSGRYSQGSTEGRLYYSKDRVGILEKMAAVEGTESFALQRRNLDTNKNVKQWLG